jgi:TetR/AcrR family transcriptional repressor of lmrAB and yxaGH operons
MARLIHEKSDVLPLVAEIFRELGYEGASFGQITSRTGISKGSLYHFFPGGKEQMAAEVLAEIDGWFVNHVYQPLETGAPAQAIGQMWTEVDRYFRSGRRVCLVGAFALDATRDHFAASIHKYFMRWISALKTCLERAGMPPAQAAALAEDAVLGIQGALVLARAVNDDNLFVRAMHRLSGTVGRALRTDI